MERPTLKGCNYDADLFVQRVAEYAQAIAAEIETKERVWEQEKEAWAASLRLRADDFDGMALSDPDNAEYCRGMAQEYREMAERSMK